MPRTRFCRRGLRVFPLLVRILQCSTLRGPTSTRPASSPRTHAGVHHLFNLHFVKSARFEPGTSRLMARLHKYREEADYSRAFVIDATGAREELEAARAFVETVRAQLAPGRGG